MFDPAQFLAGLMLGTYAGAIFMRAIGRRYWTKAREMRLFSRRVQDDARATYAAAQQIDHRIPHAAPPESVAALLEAPGAGWDCAELGHVQEWGDRRCVVCLDPDPYPEQT